MEECLQDHREEEGFSDRCRAALESRMELAAGDYELNYGLRWGRGLGGTASVSGCARLGVRPAAQYASWVKQVAEGEV